MEGLHLERRDVERLLIIIRSQWHSRHCCHKLERNCPNKGLGTKGDLGTLHNYSSISSVSSLA